MAQKPPQTSEDRDWPERELETGDVPKLELSVIGGFPRIKMASANGCVSCDRSELRSGPGKKESC